MKTTQQIADLFDETRWAKDFDRDEVEVIARHMSVHTYSPDEYVFRQGDRQRYMAFIVEGEVDILKESADLTERIVVTLYRRTHFGEMAFIDDEPRSASAVARKHTTLLVLSTEAFDSICEKHPRIGLRMVKNIARILSQRLRMTTGRLVYTTN